MRMWTLAIGGVVLLGSLAASGGARRAQAPSDLEAYKAELQKLAGGVWIASNQAYLAEDGGPDAPDAYGMAWVVQPSGLAATGCLWGQRDGKVGMVFWQFFQGWDPMKGAALFYQSHVAGLVGMGYLEDRGVDQPELVQDFWSPDGSMFRSGHFETWEGPDTRQSRSVDWADGRWEAGRSYTWLREQGAESPC